MKVIQSGLEYSVNIRRFERAKRQSNVTVNHRLIPLYCDVVEDSRKDKLRFQGASLPPWHPSSEELHSQKSVDASILAPALDNLLKENNVEAALIARSGRTGKHDWTGMTHVGIAVPKVEGESHLYSYTIYELVDRPPSAPGENPKADIHRTTLEDFFRNQSVVRKDFLLMIPARRLQEPLKNLVRSGDYEKLLFTDNYNFISAPHTLTSLNCTKLTVMMMRAARYLQDKINASAILNSIQQDIEFKHFQPGRIRVNPLLRPFAKRKLQHIVIPQEIPAFGPIRSISVQSLYESGWFEKKIFYDPSRKLPKSQ